jgi:flagellar hook-basal body complex protein FliE
VNSISDIAGYGKNIPVLSKNVQGAEESFQETLNGFIKDVDGLIKDAGAKADGLVRGEVGDIHQVMIAAQKASVGLDLVIEMRNKLLESYRELMRMQV